MTNKKTQPKLGFLLLQTPLRSCLGLNRQEDADGGRASTGCAVVELQLGDCEIALVEHLGSTRCDRNDCVCQAVDTNVDRAGTGEVGDLGKDGRRTVVRKNVDGVAIGAIGRTSRKRQAVAAWESVFCREVIPNAAVIRYNGDESLFVGKSWVSKTLPVIYVCESLTVEQDTVDLVWARGVDGTLNRSTVDHGRVEVPLSGTANALSKLNLEYAHCISLMKVISYNI